MLMPAGGGIDPSAAALFAGLDQTPALLLAVSGGPDSMALMLLASGWAASAPGPKLHVATVDHGLRPEARTEAEFVGAAASRLGLPHAILTWEGEKPKTRIQERARDARYALLADHARAIGASHILTAHHADDQAETILFRLGRGSGPAGLTGMKRETRLTDGVTLVRPLLGLTKAELGAICRAADQPVLDDPSNHDPRYARVRLRADEAAARRLGLDTPNLLRLAARLARAEEVLEAETRRCLTLAEAQSGPERFEARLAPLGGLAAEILIRLLRHGVECVGPADRPPRLERLEALAADLGVALAQGQALRATLHGTCIRLAADGSLTIVPEPTRRRGRLEARDEPAPKDRG